MTSGLASDSDKFKIIITLRRAQKNGVTRPYKNFIFLYNPFNPDFLIKLHLKSNDSKWSHWGGIAQAWTTWSEGASAPNGTVKCRGHGVPEMVTPASRTTAVLLVFKLDKYAMFSFAMTSGLASDSDKFKIIITLRRAQKNGVTRPYKNFIFLYNPFNPDFLIKFHLKSNDSKWSHWGGIAQAWTTWSEGASAPNGTVKCRGHGVPEMVTPASRTTAVSLVI